MFAHFFRAASSSSLRRPWANPKFLTAGAHHIAGIKHGDSGHRGFYFQAFAGASLASFLSAGTSISWCMDHAPDSTSGKLKQAFQCYDIARDLVLEEVGLDDLQAAF